MNPRSYVWVALPALLMITVACRGPGTHSRNEPAATGVHMDNSHMDETDGTHMGDEHMSDDHVHVDPPAEFAGLSNPFAQDEAALAAGKVIFATNCATCHGPEGKGDGPTAAALDPKPAVLADRMMMEMLPDGYLFWRVSKGGAMEPFNSAMPAWESVLSEEERWQVITYVRSLSGEHMNGDHMGGDQ